MLLLRKCWCDIFLINAIQWCLPFENGFLFCTSDLVDQLDVQADENSTNENQQNENNKNQTSSSNQLNNANNGNFDSETKLNAKIEQLNEQSVNLASPKLSTENVYLSEIQSLNDCLNRFKQLAVDAPEFACLKALALFRPGM